MRSHHLQLCDECGTRWARCGSANVSQAFQPVASSLTGWKACATFSFPQSQCVNRVTPVHEEGRAADLLSTLNSQPSGGSDWAQLESGTFQMQGYHALRDPLNKVAAFFPCGSMTPPSKASPHPKLSPSIQLVT